MSTTPPPPPPSPPHSGSRPEKRKRSTSDSASAPESATTNKVCQVCGDGATIVNYGALSCLSCRTFFRRNAYPNRAVVPCRFDGHCEVNILTRRACTACRLNKCLAVGMSPDLIRKEDLTVQKRKSPKIVTEEIRSQLTTAEQTLISNITHAFETFSPIPSIRMRLTALPLTIEVSFSSEIISSCYQSLQSFIRSLPDFQVLTSEEQTSLFHRNLFGVLFLGSLYLLRESGLFEHENSDAILRHLYGEDFLEQTKSIARQIPSDPILCHLLLIALAFSSHSHFLLPAASNHLNSNRDSFLFGTFRLFGSQNVYVELLWKYLSESSSTFHQAVQLYSNLIRQLLDTLRLAQTIYNNNSIHQTCINEILERNDTDRQRVPLWGKQ